MYSPLTSHDKRLPVDLSDCFTAGIFEDVMSMAPAAIFRCNGIPEDGSDIIADDDEP